MFRGDGWGRLLIDGLVGTHRAGVRDCMDCSIPLCLIPEIERKAGVHDRFDGLCLISSGTQPESDDLRTARASGADGVIINKK